MWCFWIYDVLQGAAPMDVGQAAPACNCIDIQPIRGTKELWLVVGWVKSRLTQLWLARMVFVLQTTLQMDLEPYAKWILVFGARG